MTTAGSKGPLMRFSLASLVLLSAIAIPAAAHASSIDNFTITNGTHTLSFSLPSSPLHIDGSYPDNFFVINAIPAIYDGVPVTDEFFGCYTADAGGGFLDGFFGQPFGGQYFTGDVLSPTFLPGVYDYLDEAGNPMGTITISATPEPSSLILLGSGILGVAGFSRRRFLKS